MLLAVTCEPMYLENRTRTKMVHSGEVFIVQKEEERERERERKKEKKELHKVKHKHVQPELILFIVGCEYFHPLHNKIFGGEGVFLRTKKKKKKEGSLYT